ncbi:MAG: AraC family transcriptional regulator [Lachnospiraceae bacterium]|nr:AraC family transcriptional regulator [Lachnospiraceae bacterium]
MERSMEHVLDYIEENLTEPFTMEQLAKVAGYSKYHFIRIFAEVTGFTPADYIRKRRISEIADRLMENGYRGSIAELAFQYGFNSKENFLRAFKAEHCVLPNEYRRVKNSLHLFPKFSSKAISVIKEPSFVFLAPFSLTVMESDETVPTRFWNKYNCSGMSLRLSGGKIVPDFGVSDWDVSAGKLRYYIGIRTEEANGDISGTKTLWVDEGVYAVFKTKYCGTFHFVDTIQKTWEYINTQWLKESGYMRTGGYEFETYLESSRTYSEEIYIPICRGDSPS